MFTVKSRPAAPAGARLPAALILAVALLGPGSGEKAAACGTIDMAYRQFSAAVQDKNQQSMDATWYMLTDCNIRHTYKPGESDLQILAMIQHLVSGLPPMPSTFDPSVVSEVFQEYHCLYPARESRGYRALAKRLPVTCDFDAMQSWRVVTAPSEANLRSSASREGDKVATLLDRTLVAEITRQGEWVKVETRRQPTFHERPDLVGWIHVSLLRDYGTIPEN